MRNAGVRQIVLTMAFGLVLVNSASATPSEVRMGNWEYLSIVDKMDNKPRYIALIKGDGGALAVKCDEPGPGNVYVMYFSEKYLGEGRSGHRVLQYKMDSGPAIEDKWKYDKNYAAIFDNKRVVDFAHHLQSSSTLLIRAYTYDFESVDTEFTLSGADRAVAQVIKDCSGR